MDDRGFDEVTTKGDQPSLILHRVDCCGTPHSTSCNVKVITPYFPKHIVRVSTTFIREGWRGYCHLRAPQQRKCKPSSGVHHWFFQRR